MGSVLTHPTGTRSHSHVSGKYVRGAGGSSWTATTGKPRSIASGTALYITLGTSVSSIKELMRDLKPPGKGRAETGFHRSLHLSWTLPAGSMKIIKILFNPLQSLLVPNVFSGWLQVPLRTWEPGLGTSSLLFSPDRAQWSEQAEGCADLWDLGNPAPRASRTSFRKHRWSWHW